MTDEEVVLHDNLNSLKVNLKKVETGKIVLIGDIMLDCYIHGFANNLNSRAPVPVIRETRREEDVGAAAHVARGLVSMGFESQIFGVIGDDRPGMSILEFLEDEGVSTDGIGIVEGRKTTVKTRLLATRESLVQGEQLLLRWDVEDDANIPEQAIEAINEQAIEQLNDSFTVILSDYGQGVVNDEGVDNIIKSAKSMNIPIIADPKLTGLHRTHGVDWIVFQSRGFELMRRRIGETSDDSATKNLIETYDWKHLVVLSGESGVTIYSADEDTVHAPCTLGELRQMIGLIDAAVVAIAISISNNLDVRNTAILTNAACECILGAEQTDSFVLNREDLINRIGEIAWNLQVSKR